MPVVVMVVIKAKNSNKRNFKYIMITYEYECEHCEHSLEVKQHVDDKPKKKCPSCKKHKLFRVVTCGAYIAIKCEPKTLGHLAARNSEKLGHKRVEELEKAHKQRTQDAKRQALIESGKLPAGASIPEIKTPWFGELSKKKTREIADSSGDEKTKKINKYIMEGK